MAGADGRCPDARARRARRILDARARRPGAGAEGATRALAGGAPELDRLSDQIAELSAHLDAATARLLELQKLNRAVEVYTTQMMRVSEIATREGTRAFGATTPMAAFEEQAQRNMALFQQALSMWSPFAAGMPGAAKSAEPAGDDDTAKDQQLADLRRQMEAMQKQLDAMARPKG